MEFELISGTEMIGLLILFVKFLWLLPIS